MTAPGGAKKHRHCATIDDEGDGCTTPGPDGHVHEIVGLVVQPAGLDQHTHDMSAQRCSSPHERGVCQR